MCHGFAKATGWGLFKTNTHLGTIELCLVLEALQQQQCTHLHIFSFWMRFQFLSNQLSHRKSYLQNIVSLWMWSCKRSLLEAKHHIRLSSAAVMMPDVGPFHHWHTGSSLHFYMEGGPHSSSTSLLSTYAIVLIIKDMWRLHVLH